MSAPSVKAFAYIYLSRSDDDPRPRREVIERRAASLGVEVVGEFIDYGQSPKSGETLPQFQAMLTAIRERRDIGAVVVPRLGQTHNRRLEMHMTIGLRAVDVLLLSAYETTTTHLGTWSARYWPHFTKRNTATSANGDARRTPPNNKLQKGSSHE